MEETQIVHPCHEHPLRRYSSYKHGLCYYQTCQGCGDTLPPDDVNYECPEEGCEFHICNSCARLKDASEIHHPLHAQHPLTVHLSIDSSKFICSFCGETKESSFYYRCSQGQCDFYLDVTCSTRFTEKKDLLDKYQFQHFLHDDCYYENHHLSPYIVSAIEAVTTVEKILCYGCDLEVVETPIFQCTKCYFCLHTQCSQVPKVVQHNFHPPHPLSLLHISPFESKNLISCFACLMTIEGGFYLHCTDCPFDLHLRCSFLKHNAEHGLHNEHPLAHYDQIYPDDVRCAACNTLCNRDLFRCFHCNFNIHKECLSLPSTVDYYDHVHPLTLTSSFKEADGHHFCSICEKRRDPDYGVYLCKGCEFVAHFKCALSTSEEASSSDAEIKEEDLLLTPDELVFNIFLQLNEEIPKLGRVVQQLMINKRLGKQLTEKLNEIDEWQANVEGMLIQLKQSLTKTN